MNFFFAVFDTVHHILPFGKVALRSVYAELAADYRGEICFFEHQRCFIKIGKSDIFYYAVGLYIAEKRDFLEDGILKRFITTQNNDIRVDTHSAKLLYRVLCRLRLMLVRAAKKRHERDMNEEAVFTSDLERNLTHRLEKRLGFDIAYRAADFRYHDIGIRLLADAIDKILYFVCDMRDDLHCRTEIFSAALLIQHIPVYLACRQV